MTANDERYTTAEVVEQCRKLAGVPAFDLDPAACEESHWAPTWFKKSDSGLQKPWFGHVWVNPPYSNIESWVRKARKEIADGNVKSVTMLLPANRCDQEWWHKYIEPFRDNGGNLRTHFLRGRAKFSAPGLGGKPIKGTPFFGCVLAVWRVE